MNKLMSVMILCCLVLVLPSISIQAQTGAPSITSGIAVATKMELLMHEKPMAASEVIETIPGAWNLQASKRTEDGQWIFLCDDWFHNCGWVPSTQLYTLGDLNRLPIYNQEIQLVNQQSLQLYSGTELLTQPHYGAAVIGTIPGATVVSPHCSTADAAWYFLEINGKLGWFSNSYAAFYGTSPQPIPICDGTQVASPAYERVDPQAGAAAIQAASVCPEYFDAVGNNIVFDTRNRPVDFPSLIGLFELLDSQVRPDVAYNNAVIHVKLMEQGDMGSLFEWSGGNYSQWSSQALGGAARMYMDGCELTKNQGTLVNVVVIAVSRGWSAAHYYGVFTHELSHWLGAEHGPASYAYNGWDAGNWYRLTQDGTATPDNYFEVADAAIYGLCDFQLEQKFVDRCYQIRQNLEQDMYLTIAPIVSS